MNLTCPSCCATFLVEPEQLGPAGHRVRCGECRHTWRQVAVGEDPAPAPGSAPEPEPAVNPAAEQVAAKAAAKPFAPSKADAGVGEAPEPATPEPQAEAAPAAAPGATPVTAPRSRGNPFRRAVSRRAFSKPARPQPKQPQVLLAAGWAISAVVVIGMASGFYYGRAPLVAMVPEMTHLYDLVGLKDEALELGLELRYIKSVPRVVNGERVMVAEGLGGNLLNQE